MVEVLIVPAVIAGFVAAHFFRRGQGKRRARPASPEDPVKFETGTRSPKTVCEHLAAALDANAIVIERAGDEIVVVAGAPWKTDIQPLDKIALDWCFVTGLPPKSGGGNPFGSDWLFLPVHAGGKVAAVLGVMARHGRRRFDPDRQPSIHSAMIAMDRIYEARVQSRAGHIYLRDNQIRPATKASEDLTG